MLTIELDKPGKHPPYDPPHWLLEHGRAWLRWYNDQQRQERAIVRANQERKPS